MNAGISATPEVLGAAISVATVADLAAYDASGLTLGTRIYVQEVGSAYELTLSPIAGDGHLTVAVSGITKAVWRCSDLIYVDDFLGAAGTDAGALQAAFDRRRVAGRGVIVLAPRAYTIPAAALLKLNNVADPSAAPLTNVVIVGPPASHSYDGIATSQAQILVDTPTVDTVALDATYCPGFRVDSIALSPVVYPTTHAGLGTGLKLDHSPQWKIADCNISGWGTGIAGTSAGIGQATANNISDCNTGALMQSCGDSQWTDNYVNTNNPDYSGSDSYSGAGIVLVGCGNTKIRGGKVEWNRKGILVVSSSGYSIKGIQFDTNREYDIGLSSETSPKNGLAIYSGNVASASITGCRFIGSGAVGDVNAHPWNGACIGLHRVTGIAISGNTFADGGPHAYDGNVPAGGEATGPKYAFIRVNGCGIGGVAVTGNAFHSAALATGGPSPTTTRPLFILDSGDALRSMVVFAGNSTPSAPQMGYYGDGSSEQRTYHAYETDALGRKRAYSLTDTAPAADGTFDIGDLVFKASAAAAGWRCTVAGTFGTLTTAVTASTTAASKVVTLSADLDETKIAPGDYITIAGVTGAKKVLRMDSPAGGPITMTVDVACDATVAGAAIAYQAPTLAAFP